MVKMKSLLLLTEATASAASSGAIITRMFDIDIDIERVRSAQHFFLAETFFQIFAQVHPTARRIGDDI